MTKNCKVNGCTGNNPQPFENFNKNKKGKHGLYYMCKSCQSASNKQRFLTEEGRLKARKNLIHNYWPYLTKEEAYQEFLNMEAAQNKLCKICSRPQSDIDPKYGKVRDLCIDHCHITGVVRGLLCSLCNRGLGQFSDDPDRVQLALDYLIDFYQRND